MDFSTPTQFLLKLLTYIPQILQSSVYEKYIQFWPLFVGGILLSFVLTPLIGQFALKYDITYKPGTKRNGRDFDNEQKALHEGITPALGGLAVTIPILLAMIIFFKLDSFTIPIIVATAILVIGSALDDIFNLPAKVQFSYQILAALIISASLVNLTNLSFLNIPLDMYTWNFSISTLHLALVFPGDIILFFWILICINAVKWTAGSPGIIEANSLVIFSLIFVIAIRYNSIFTSVISSVAVGCLLIFLLFALPPQKIMTGSSGKTVYGFLICILSLIADAKMSTTIMLILLPVIDFAYVIIKRILTYKPKNLVELMRINDTSHLHHQLIKLDLSRKQIVLIEMAATLFLGSFAILSTGAFRYFAIIFGTALGISFIVFINIKASRQRIQKDKKQSPESKYSY